MGAAVMNKYTYCGPFKPLIQDFIELKQAIGYQYFTEAEHLKACYSGLFIILFSIGIVCAKEIRNIYQDVFFQKSDYHLFLEKLNLYLKDY